MRSFLITALILCLTLQLTHGQQIKKSESKREMKLKYSSPGNISTKDYSAADHTAVLKGNNNIKVTKAQNKKVKSYYRSKKIIKKPFPSL